MPNLRMSPCRRAVASSLRDTRQRAEQGKLLPAKAARRDAQMAAAFCRSEVLFLAGTPTFR